MSELKKQGKSTDSTAYQNLDGKWLVVRVVGITEEKKRFTFVDDLQQATLIRVSDKNQEELNVHPVRVGVQMYRELTVMDTRVHDPMVGHPNG